MAITSNSEGPCKKEKSIKCYVKHCFKTLNKTAAVPHFSLRPLCRNVKGKPNPVITSVPHIWIQNRHLAYI